MTVLWLGENQVEEVVAGGGWGGETVGAAGSGWWMREGVDGEKVGCARWSRGREGGDVMA
jgi:hypothetical protein